LCLSLTSIAVSLTFIAEHSSYGGTLSRTHDYHRVMAHAYEKGGEPLQRKVAESFFTGYFENEQDPGQRPYLVKTALDTGVFASEKEANDFFDSSAFDKEVNAGYRQAKELGVSGVPFFVLDNKYGISGAQPPEAFLQVFEQLSKEKKPQPEQLADGGACEVGKECS
jgi:predicted DsbA family dithiol-disulfide isomerase